MGGTQSAEEGSGGFRVFKVTPGSPAAEAGFEVFFDFITEIGGTPMDASHETFTQKIKESENKRTKVVVFNIRTQTSREVHIMPRRWGGSGLLGAVVRYDSLDNVENQGLRVVEVFPNSPAAEAGLVQFKDFLLGTPEVMFRDMDELVEVVNYCVVDEQKKGQVQLYVYNSDTESIREVTIAPRRGWGGDGLMGADVRTGILHRIPPPRRPFQLQTRGVAAGVAAPAPPGAGEVDENSGPSVASLLKKFGGERDAAKASSHAPQPPRPTTPRGPPPAHQAVAAAATSQAAAPLGATPTPPPAPQPPAPAPGATVAGAEESAPAAPAPGANAQASPATSTDGGVVAPAAVAVAAEAAPVAAAVPPPDAVALGDEGQVGTADGARPAAACLHVQPPLTPSPSPEGPSPLAQPSPAAQPLPASGAAAPALSTSDGGVAGAAVAAATPVVVAAVVAEGVRAIDVQGPGQKEESLSRPRCYGAFFELTPGNIYEVCEAT